MRARAHTCTCTHTACRPSRSLHGDIPLLQHLRDPKQRARSGEEVLVTDRVTDRVTGWAVSTAGSSSTRESQPEWTCVSAEPKPVITGIPRYDRYRLLHREKGVARGRFLPVPFPPPTGTPLASSTHTQGFVVVMPPCTPIGCSDGPVHPMPQEQEGNETSFSPVGGARLSARSALGRHAAVESSCGQRLLADVTRLGKRACFLSGGNNVFCHAVARNVCSAGA